MKKRNKGIIEIALIVLIAGSVVLALSYAVFKTDLNPQIRISGFSIHEEPIEKEEIQETEEITEEQATREIEASIELIAQLKSSDFNTKRLEDLLLNAEITLKQVRFAEILRDEESNHIKKREARTSLELISWEDLNYSDVLKITNEIKDLQNRANMLSYSIDAEEIALSPEEGEIQDLEVTNLINEVNNAYEEERYEDAEALLLDLRDLKEKVQSEKTFGNTIKKNTQNFIKRYSYQIIIALFLIGILSYFSYIKINRKLLKNKILKMKTEEKALLSLMKKAQTERFKEKKLSELIYKIRMKKYKERRSEIDEELPVLEARYNKKSKPKTLKT
jgi:hypothetical protein